MSQNPLFVALRDEARRQRAEDPEAMPEAPSAETIARAEALALRELRSPRRARSQTVWIAAASVVAIAAAAALFWPRASAVPAYEVAIVEGAQQRVRADDTPRALVLHPGAAFEVVARPSTQVEGEIAARAFLVVGTETMPLDVQTRANVSGVVHVRGVWPKVEPPRGELLILVGRPSELAHVRPSELKATVRVLRVPVER